jgi:PAS domain S-box-containing protein
MLERIGLKRSVVNDLVVWLSVSLSLVIVVLGAVLVTLYLHQAERDLLDKARSRTRELSKVIRNPMWNVDREGIERIADAYLQGEFVAGIRITEADSVLTTSGSKVIYKRGDVDKPGLVREEALVLKGNQKLGRVVLTFSRDPLHQTSGLIVRTVFFLMAAVILFIYVITRIILRKMLYVRLRDQIEGIRSIAAGNYQKRLDPVPQHDLDALNTEVNTMARQIEAREQELEKEISERKNAEKALKNSERRYRSIFENSLDGIFQISPTGEPLNVNPAMATILGFDSVQELMRLVDNMQDMFATPREGEEFLSRLHNEGRVVNIERRIRKKDDTHIWLQIQAQTIRSRDGDIESLEGFAKDVTARKLAEEELHEVNRNLELRVAERTRELEQANRDLLRAKEQADAAARAKSRFLANMSHEIRTPMNGVITSAELALQEEMSEKTRRYLSIIKRSGEQLLGSVNDILDFSKADAGQMHLESHGFDLRELLESSASGFEHKTREKQIELIIDMDSGLPRDLIGDSLRLRQIIVNFLSNALKFTDSGGVVILSAKKCPESGREVWVEFAVADTGRGMNDEEQSLLFQPFSQADASTTRKYGGTGLGLAICKQLVQLMGGEIGARSTPGQGSRFYFRVPLGVQKDARSLEQKIPSHIGVHKVLIVDDCEEIVLMLRKILANCGLDAETHTSPERALQRVKDGPCDFDLLIIDYSMPGMNGLDLCREIKQRCGDMTPVMMISAYENEISSPDMQGAGVDVFVPKPLNQSLVMDTLVGFFGPEYESDGEEKQSKAVSGIDMRKKRLSGFRVLVAEDNSINQEIVRDVLENAGMECRVAENGLQALQALRESDFDAVLMDVQMPEMDGFEATRRIREEHGDKAPAIIAMTAHALKGDAERCLKAGMDAYVSKPINQDALYRTMWEALQKSHDQGGSFAPETGKPEETEERESFSPDMGVVDIDAALEELGVGRESVLRVLGKFRDKYRDIVPEFRALADAGDWQAFHDLAHSLKGSAGQLRINAVQKAAYFLETASKTGEVKQEDIQEGLSGLERTIAEMVRELEGI